jgi:hypothetical protein
VALGPDEDDSKEDVASMKPGARALIGGLFIVPFAAANAIVGNRIEPFFSFIRPGPHTSAFEYVLLAVVLACLPVGAFIAAQPMLKTGADGRRVHLANAAVALVMLALFVILSVGLGSDIYRCDVLQIPNCD